MGYGNTLIGPAFDAFEETYTEAKTKIEEVDQQFRRESLESLINLKGIKRLTEQGWLQSESISDVLPAGYLDAKPATPIDHGEDQSNSSIIESAKAIQVNDDHKA